MKKYILLVALALSLSSLFGQKKILFDNTKNETASNADWIIDDDQPIPSPAQSGIAQNSAETYWQGALSSWGVEMVKRGYYVETLPSSGSITYNDASNSQDLSKYDIFVVCEPNNPFSSSEKKAMIDFVQNGGGLFIVSDHAVADRDGDGWDALEVWNDFFASYSNPFGFTVDVGSNVSLDPATNVANLPSNDILHGPAGDVDGLAFYNGATFTIDKNANPTAVGLVYYNGYSNTGTTGVMAVCATYGNGRVVAVGDSSVPEDETAHDNSHTYPGWYQPYNAGNATGDDGVFMTNATIWLGLSQSTINPEPTNNVTGFSATDITSKSIKLVWTDAVGANLPSGYLIKWGTTSSIVAPTDGIAVNNGVGVANVSQGVQTYTVSGLNPNTIYYFKIYPYSNSGSSIDYLVSETPSASAKTLDGLTVINTEDFENCAAISWTAYDVAGDDYWICGSGYEEMNGFNGTTDEDWLISPALNLNNYSSVVMTFTTATQYDGPSLELVYSTNYDGTSNPSTQGTWTSLNFTPATTIDFTSSGNVNLSGISGSAVYIAFKYKATGTTAGAAARWMVDNILIEGSTGVSTAPTVQSFSPANNAVSVMPTDNLVLTFSENIKQGTSGNIKIYNSNATVFETIPYNDSRVTILNNTVTVNPSAQFTSSSSYYVNIDGTVFQNLSGNFYAGISSNTDWNFSVKDVISPTIQSLNPVDNSTSVSTTDNLILSFSEDVKRGTAGSITIYNSNATVFETIPYSDSRILFQGNAVTVNPSSNFSAGLVYYVNIDNKVIADNSNNYFAGLSSSSEWNFTIQTSSSIPETNANIATIYPNPAKDFISIKFPEDFSMVEVSIIDINGKGVYSSVVKNQNSIDISRYSKGLYFVKLIAKGTVYVNKLIIQ